MKYKLFGVLMVTIFTINTTLSVFASPSFPYSTSIGVNFRGNNTYDSVDTTNDAEQFSKDMASIGFNTILKQTMTYQDWNKKWKTGSTADVESNSGKKLLEADILMLTGHGTPDGLFFNEGHKYGNYATGLATGYDREMTFKDSASGMSGTFKVMGVESHNFGDTLLAVFCGCRTASGGPTSVARQITKNGASIGIGWTEVIDDSDAEIWLERFGKYLRLDYSIIDAMNKASSYNHYEDKEAIEAISGYSISTSYLNTVLSDYVKGSRSVLEGRESEDDDVLEVKEDIAYSFKDEDISQISSFIQENINENFDPIDYDVFSNLKIVTDDENDTYGTVNLQYKLGDFLTEDGYYITIKNGLVDKIYINGDPTSHQNDIMPIDLDIDDNELKEMALNQINLQDNEEILQQKVIKKFDTEPYVTIKTEIINNDNDFTRAEIYEYRR